MYVRFHCLLLKTGERVSLSIGQVNVALVKLTVNHALWTKPKISCELRRRVNNGHGKCLQFANWKTSICHRSITMFNMKNCGKPPCLEGTSAC